VLFGVQCQLLVNLGPRKVSLGVVLLGVQCQLLVNLCPRKFSLRHYIRLSLCRMLGLILVYRRLCRLPVLTIFATPINVLDVPTGWKRLREIMLFIGKPKGRSRMISNTCKIVSNFSRPEHSIQFVTPSGPGDLSGVSLCISSITSFLSM